jgi:hypothetical protein
MNVVRWIKEGCCPKKKTMAEIETKTNKKLESWKVQMYASNPHLMKIPQERIDRTRETIFDQLCAKYGISPQDKKSKF